MSTAMWRSFGPGGSGRNRRRSRRPEISHHGGESPGCWNRRRMRRRRFELLSIAEAPRTAVPDAEELYCRSYVNFYLGERRRHRTFAYGIAEDAEVALTLRRAYPDRQVVSPRASGPASRRRRHSLHHPARAARPRYFERSKKWRENGDVAGSMIPRRHAMAAPFRRLFNQRTFVNNKSSLSMLYLALIPLICLPCRPPPMQPRPSRPSPSSAPASSSTWKRSRVLANQIILDRGTKIGVLIDPGCPRTFPRTISSLRRFDGTALYEHEDARRGEHPDWGHADLQLRSQ